jgi:MarR family transcriptional regulator for hemolysin
MVVTLLNDTREDCSQKFLADHLDVAPASLVPLLKQIEADGLITRRQDDDDRRVNHIELTARGERLAKEARRVLDAVRARLFADVDQGDLDAAVRVAGNLQRAITKTRLK